jgi:hypothetical protein
LANVLNFFPGFSIWFNLICLIIQECHHDGKKY